jgi:cell fate (sporulation/competence/biofilm development) regulator YlbF (YheA/YmcA/DUF963 family)
MDIIEKARELGKMIASSDELLELKKAEEIIEANLKSRELLNEYKELQKELVRATKRNMEKVVIEECKESLLAKQEELNDYEPTGRYLESKMSFDKLIKTINDVIMFSITGEEQCSPSKCGSCGGCK